MDEMNNSVERNTACGVHVQPLLFPLNKSLEEEVERLFSKLSSSSKTADCETIQGKHLCDKYTALNSLVAFVRFQSVPARVYSYQTKGC
jgi:hypothetical protein